MASSTRRWEQILRVQELLLQAPSCGQGCRPGCSRCAAPPGLGGAQWKAGREPRWGGGKKGWEGSRGKSNTPDRVRAGGGEQPRLGGRRGAANQLRFPLDFRRHQHTKSFLVAVVNKSPKPRAHTEKANSPSGFYFCSPKRDSETCNRLKPVSDPLPLSHVTGHKAEGDGFGKQVPPLPCLHGSRVTGGFSFLCLFPSLHYYFLCLQPP